MKAEDLMQIEITVRFKVSPETASDAMPLPSVCEWSATLCGDEAGELLDEIAEAVFEKRLFGWLQTQVADTAIDCDEWHEA